MAGNKVPDAWDDDWESQADKGPKEEPSPGESAAPMTRAERLARHEASNKKLWESA